MAGMNVDQLNQLCTAAQAAGIDSPLCHTDKPVVIQIQQQTQASSSFFWRATKVVLITGILAGAGYALYSLGAQQAAKVAGEKFKDFAETLSEHLPGEEAKKQFTEFTLSWLSKPATAVANMTNTKLLTDGSTEAEIFLYRTWGWITENVQNGVVKVTDAVGLTTPKTTVADWVAGNFSTSVLKQMQTMEIPDLVTPLTENVMKPVTQAVNNLVTKSILMTTFLTSSASSIFFASRIIF